MAATTTKCPYCGVTLPVPTRGVLLYTDFDPTTGAMASLTYQIICVSCNTALGVAVASAATVRPILGSLQTTKKPPYSVFHPSSLGGGG